MRLTAAHKTLPLPGLVEVTNLANGRRIVVRVNDRGPFVDNRIIDLSRGAAEALGMLQAGVGEVRVRYLGRAPRTGGGTTLQHAAEHGSRAAGAPWNPPRGATSGSRPAAFSDRRAARRVADQLGDRATVDVR
jgi:rare lipoprotein A